MEDQVKEFNERYDLLHKKLVLAVSTGADSMALLNLYQALGANIVVAHLNHGLRPESVEEEGFLGEYCKKRGILFFSKKLPVAPKSEAEARERRYAFLEEVREQTESDFVLTAHHLNDQIETFFMKIARGSGVLEPWGIPEQRGTIVRPFLEIPKDVLAEYVQAEEVPFFEDATNKDLRFARNRIRNLLIPDLVKLNPNLLMEMAEILREGKQFSEDYSAVIGENLKKVMSESGLDLKALVLIPAHLREEVIFLYLKAQGVELTEKTLQEILKVLGSEGTKQITLGKTIFVKEHDFFGPQKAPVEAQTQRISVGESVRFGDFAFRLLEAGKSSSKNNILLPQALAYNLLIRPWRPGDKIRTQAGTKKLSDLFTDAKIPRSERLAWPVVTNEEEVVWVPLLAKSNISEKALFNLEVIDERKK